MKKWFLDSSINLIKKNKNYSESEIEIIAYGLEGLYLTFTKAIVIFGIAIILGIFREMLYLLISYNLIRSQAFGIHASKSLYCLLSSLTLFIGGTFLCMYINISLWIMVAISFICIIFLLLYAPADTHKRPIVNQKKRKRFKTISVILGMIYTILIIIFDGKYLSNYLLFGMISSVIMILPITYKLFNMPYKNYINYINGV